VDSRLAERCYVAPRTGDHCSTVPLFYRAVSLRSVSHRTASFLPHIATCTDA